jgi:hypothetical protein
MGDVIISLQDIEAWAGGIGDDPVILIKDRRDNGAKLTQARQQFLLKIARVSGEVLHTEIDQMALPELSGATSSNRRGAFKEMDGNSCSLQGLGTTQPRETGSNNCNRTIFFHGRITYLRFRAITLTRSGGKKESIIDAIWCHFLIPVDF